MKAKICVFAVLLCCGSINNMYAQKGIHVGFGTAITSAWIINQNNAKTLEDYPDISKSELAYKIKFGYRFGGIVGYNFKNHYGLQFQINYEKTGQNYEDNFSPFGGPLNVVRNVDLTYVSIPFLFKYISRKGHNVKAYGMAGPQINFLLKASEVVILNGTEKIDSLSANDKFNAFDFGFGIGGGADIFLKQNFYFNVGLYSYIGISDINSEAVKSFISKNDNAYKGSKNFRGGLSVGFHYMFTKRHRTAWGNTTKKTFKMD